jgi:hypothetical protein
MEEARVEVHHQPLRDLHEDGFVEVHRRKIRRKID